MTAADMATNCEAAAARLAATGNPADAIDAATLRAAARLHRQDAENEERATAAEAAKRARQWWRD